MKHQRESSIVKYFIFILFLQFLLMTGLWAIDIGSSGLVWETCLQQSGEAQGLIFTRTANQQYHIGLILVFIVSFVQLIWLANWIVMSHYSSKPTDLNTPMYKR